MGKIRLSDVSAKSMHKQMVCFVNISDPITSIIYLRQKTLTSKIEGVEQAHISSKHGEAWKLIKDISGAQTVLTAQSSKLKADSPDERVKLWSDHFNNLLGIKMNLFSLYLKL